MAFDIFLSVASNCMNSGTILLPAITLTKPTFFILTRNFAISQVIRDVL